MDQISSDDARRDFRRLLDAAMRGEHVIISRYGEPVAVLVSQEWYEQAQAELEGAAGALKAARS